MTELRLTSGAYEEHHKKFRNVQCNLTAMIFFHQGKSKIDSGSNSRRSVYSTVSHKDRLGLNNSVRKFFGQSVAKSPVCHNLLAIEKSSRSEQKRARANGGDA